MIDRLEYFHSKSYLHRDVKPDNFLMGMGSEKHICYIIDYGLAKKYQDPTSGEHIEYEEVGILILSPVIIMFNSSDFGLQGYSNFNGTADFISITNHLGIEQSRRDDMESLGYVLMFFLHGSLPWQGMKAATKQEKYRRILERKLSTVSSALCRGYPTQFQDYFTHCASLQFEAKPDYDYLRGMFRELFESQGFEDDGIFDWDIVKKERESRGIFSGVEAIYDGKTDV